MTKFECRICAIRDIRGSPNSSSLLVSIRSLFIILLRELCSEVLKNLKNLYAELRRFLRGRTTDDADITDWGAHAARVHVSAASLKQSLFHTKNDKMIESGKQESRKGWAEGLKLVRLPPSLAATLAALPSISEIPFLD